MLTTRQSETTTIETKLTDIALHDVTRDGTFEGYASLFNQEDLGHDVVVPGAFRQSLATRGASGIRMLFQHDPGQPLGTWQKIHEDARGLFVRGRLTLAAGKARDVHALMQAGAIDGLSIGFRAVKSVKDKRTSIRRLERIDLWEISVVTFPMLPDARVERVKANPFPGQVPSARQFEQWLTRDAGLSRPEARAVSREGLKGLSRLKEQAQAGHRPGGLLAQIEQAVRLLRQTESQP